MLDDREEAIFRQLEAQLLEDDPSFGRTADRALAPRWAAWGALGLGLSLLPFAAMTGWFVLAGAGYLVATLAVVHLWQTRVPTAETTPADPERRLRRVRAAGGTALACGLTVILLAAPGGGTADRAPDESPPAAAVGGVSTDGETVTRGIPGPRPAVDLDRD